MDVDISCCTVLYIASGKVLNFKHVQTGLSMSGDRTYMVFMRAQIVAVVRGIGTKASCQTNCAKKVSGGGLSKLGEGGYK